MSLSAHEELRPYDVQLLDHEGRRTEHPEYSFNQSDAVLASWYRDLFLVRRFDTEATALQRHGELGLWAPCRGQEAAQVGSAHALSPHDFAFPTYRDHGVSWVRGVNPVDSLGLFRGTQMGGWDPRTYNLALPAIVIGTQTLHATGYAMGLSLDGRVGHGDPSRDSAVMVYFGDGATSQGDVNEALVFAASFNAPVVFFVQNNHWAISVPTDRQSKTALVNRAAGFGIRGVRVDGNDVLASYAVAKQALDNARDGNGPTFIEAVTYRMAAHTTSDDPSRYRDPNDLDYWERRDPILRLRRYLESVGYSSEFFEQIEAEAEEFGAKVREGCKSLANPELSDLFDVVTVAENPVRREQQLQHQETKASA